MEKNVVLISLFHYDNYGLRLLYSYLRDNNIPVHLINFKRMRQKQTKTLKNDFVEMHDYHTDISENDIKTLLTEIEKLNPALIGIGLQSPHFQIARRLTKEIKSKFKAPVIWGGSHPSIDPENSIKHTDIVCNGEGFSTLLELSQRILDGKSYKDVNNLWINNNGTVIKNEKRPFIDNLDILPIASYDAKNKIYIDDGQVQNDNNIDYFGFGFTDDPLKTVHQTMTSFGCPMKCSFCINATDYDKFRRRSVSSVMDELKAVKQNNPGLRLIFFWDNIFAINKKWCLEFSEKYQKEINLPFFTYSHPLFADMDIYTSLRKAGWSITVMGIQSGSYRLRHQLYNRRETNEKILETAKKLNKLKTIKAPKKYFRIYYDYVKNNPLEGKKDLKESLDLILKLPKGFTFQAFNLSFFPNYPITKEYLEKQYIDENDIEGNTGTSASNWISTFDSKKEYRGSFRRHEYYYLLFSLAQFKLFPNYLIRKIEENKLFLNRLPVLYFMCRVLRIIELNMHLTNFLWLWELITVIPLKFKLKYRTLFRYN